MVFKEDVIKKLFGEALDVFSVLCSYGVSVGKVSKSSDSAKDLKKAEDYRRKLFYCCKIFTNDFTAVFDVGIKTVKSPAVVKNLKASRKKVVAKLREISASISVTDKMFSLLTSENAAEFELEKFQDVIWEEKVAVSKIIEELNVIRGSYTYK